MYIGDRPGCSVPCKWWLRRSSVRGGMCDGNGIQEEAALKDTACIVSIASTRVVFGG